jgi:hypothetical protein
MSKTTTIVPPEIRSGFARRKNAIFGGLALLTGVYAVIYFSLKNAVRPVKNNIAD